MMRLLLFAILVYYLVRGFRHSGPVAACGAYGVVVGLVLAAFVVLMVARRIAGGDMVPCFC